MRHRLGSRRRLYTHRVMRDDEPVAPEPVGSLVQLDLSRHGTHSMHQLIVNASPPSRLSGATALASRVPQLAVSSDSHYRHSACCVESRAGRMECGHAPCAPCRLPSRNTHTHTRTMHMPLRPQLSCAHPSSDGDCLLLPPAGRIPGDALEPATGQPRHLILQRAPVKRRQARHLVRRFRHRDLRVDEEL